MSMTQVVKHLLLHIYEIPPLLHFISVFLLGKLKLEECFFQFNDTNQTSDNNLTLSHNS